WAREIVDVSIAYSEEVARARRVLDELFGELRIDDGLRDALIDGPKVLGIEQVGEKDVVLRVVAETRPSRRPDLERELRARIKERLDDRGIKVPATS
ncbi:MAG TPA: mechanosensitive ion channel family protein, partial [Actinomycetota bacterium]|nr:mechanosensitive ion channel family protein [Actinomycetota bacterium]